MVMISNYSEDPGFISLEQTNSSSAGAGSTDCSIVSTNNYCEGEVVSLDATVSNAVTYQWYRNGVLLTDPDQSGPVLNNVVAPSAVYFVEKFNSSGGLIEEETFNIVFNAVPTATQPPDYTLCDDVNPGDGVEVFDLTTQDAGILGGQDPQDYTVSYYDESGNAIADPTMYTSGSQTVDAQVTNNDNTSCFTIVPLELIVNPVPAVVALTDLVECELNTDGYYDFDLESKTDEILNLQDDPTSFEVTYHASLGDSQSGMNPLSSPYTNTNDPNITNSQLIYVNIRDTRTGCDSNAMSFNLVVQEAAVANEPVNDYVICDNLGDNDGEGQFDLTTQDAEILGGQQDPLVYTVSYYSDIRGC